MKDESTILGTTVTLTDAQVHQIAELAAEKAIEEVYIQVGKGVLRKVAYLVGLGVIALLLWLGKQGFSA